MSGPPPKQPGKRIRRATRSIGVVSAAGKAPKMPSGLCQQAKDAWVSYWSDSVSGIMRAPDITVALRWAKNLDRYHRLLAEADREPVVAGSTGQAKANPLYALVLAFEKSIREDEAQMGVGPLSRLKLGAQLAEQAKTLAEINTEAAEGGTEDPRLSLLRAVDSTEGV
jgi:P27 family predicted phage terminase small subunit